MQWVPLFLLYQYLMFFNQWDTLNAKAIVGNNIRRARDREFTFIVSISFKRNRYDALIDHICTGTLITRQHVLTAEHCMRSNLAQLQVLVGSINLYNGKSYKLKSWISYKQWIQINNFKLEYEENDISIITLQKTIDDPQIEPAALTSKSQKELYGSNVVIAGWGRTNTQRLAIILETTILKVLTKKDCLARVKKLSKLKLTVPDSVICTAADPYALLDCGESGGPLLDMNNILVGVNEGTTPKTAVDFHPEEVNIHSSINYYRNFIIDTISRT